MKFSNNNSCADEIENENSQVLTPAAEFAKSLRSNLDLIFWNSSKQVWLKTHKCF